MYCGSPKNTLELNYEDTVAFMGTVEWDKVIGWGMYGGEPSIDTALYQKFYNLLPTDISKFVITNGVWTSHIDTMDEFLKWCGGKFHIIISGTPEHKKYQNTAIVAEMKKFGGITVKSEDKMHPMGRLAEDGWICSRKCVWHEQAIRLGIFPTGDIILQNCDGVYPVIGHIKKDSFLDAFVNAQVIREKGCLKGMPNINDILKEANVL